MTYILRKIERHIHEALNRDKSVLLFGARQTGKTTILDQIKADLRISFISSSERLRYEKNPDRLLAEVEGLPHTHSVPLVIIDEIQKVPEIMDTIQDLIDRQQAKFILAGSAVRKLKHHHLNLLPGRVVVLKLMPLTIAELPPEKLLLNDLLLYGSLPGIVQLAQPKDRETDLHSYITTYLEEEIRAEALVRNVGLFARFLELASIKSGHILNFSKISQEIGLSRAIITDYFQILVDCLVAEQIEPIAHSNSRQRLTKTPKFLLFDLGIRRMSALEGHEPPAHHLGFLFEQCVGLELLRAAELDSPLCKINFWRDANGPEVDWIINKEGKFIPIEVKFTSDPTLRDTKHLQVFCEEYHNTENAYVVCQTPRRFKLADKIFAVPWQEIPELING